MVISKVKVKVFPVHSMEACRGSRDIAPLFLNLGTTWRWVFDFTPWHLAWGENPSTHCTASGENLSTHCTASGENRSTHCTEAVLALEPVWTFWRREKCLSSAGIWIPNYPAHGLVAILTLLPWPIISICEVNVYMSFWFEICMLSYRINLCIGLITEPFQGGY